MMLKLNWWSKRTAKANKTLVLMYHRVAESSFDPWELSVTAENFERQLQFLTQNYGLISVTELIENLDRKTVSPNAVCLTFDDGYRDNYLAAKPLLEKYRCPAAFFIPSENVETQRPFWWDELENIVLKSEELPEIFDLTINRKSFRFDLPKSSQLTARQRQQQQKWIWHEKPPNERCELFLMLYEQLIGLASQDLQAALQKIKLWANCDETTDRNAPMTTEQLKEIAAQPLFEICLHTHTHTALSFQPEEVQSQEITRNEQWLSYHCGKTTKALAYPNGRYDDATVRVVERQHLRAAFTTEERCVTDSSERFRLGRFQVKNWNRKEFGRQISEWMKR